MYKPPVNNGKKYHITCHGHTKPTFLEVITHILEAKTSIFHSFEGQWLVARFLVAINSYQLYRPPDFSSSFDVILCVKKIGKYMYVNIFIHIPRTQMTLVFIEKGLVLEG